MTYSVGKFRLLFGVRKGEDYWDNVVKLERNDGNEVHIVDVFSTKHSECLNYFIRKFMKKSEKKIAKIFDMCKDD